MKVVFKCKWKGDLFINGAWTIAYASERQKGKLLPHPPLKTKFQMN